MSVALKMPDSATKERVSENGRRAAAGYIVSFGAQLRRVLEAENAFKPWEVEAIVNSVVAVLQADGFLNRESLELQLHSRSIPKDLARPLAKVLSQNN